MKNWPVSIRKRWFVAARSDRVRKRPLAVTVLDVPLVLGRTVEGALFAFEDRCPHRQVPLSCGKITDHGLQCPYHGWTFGSDGKCTVVPGLAPDADIPKIGARTIACQEHNGLIWVRLAAPDEADGSAFDAPPASMSKALAGSTSQPWQARWKTSVVDAIENFLDPLHTHSLHPGLVRRGGQRRPVNVAVQMSDEGFCVDYRGQEEQSGLLYRLFESPRTTERAVFAGASSARIEYRYQDGSAIDITLHFTPESNGVTHVFGSMEVAGRWAPRWALWLFILPLLSKVGRQDQHMVELQTANKQRFGDGPSASTGLDLVMPYLVSLWQPEKTFSRSSFEKEIVLYL
jgi:phenylpropionate dioxygenase-like ring-hydroxylating dioxygenase large terminal subunit